MQEKTDKDIPTRQQRAPFYRTLVRLLWFATILGVLGVALLFIFLSYLLDISPRACHRSDVDADLNLYRLR